MSLLENLDRRLQYGPAMRAQRIVEAAFLVAAFFTGDVRFAYPTLGFSVLQSLSPRLVPVGWLVAALAPPPAQHRLSDLYFDMAGTRGACAISVFVQGAGIALVLTGHRVAGFLVLTIPTASFLLAPTVGFCCGCAVYVAGRNVLAKLGVIERYAHGACDVDIEQQAATVGHQR